MINNNNTVRRKYVILSKTGILFLWIITSKNHKKAGFKEKKYALKEALR